MVTWWLGEFGNPYASWVGGGATGCDLRRRGAGDDDDDDVEDDDDDDVKHGGDTSIIMGGLWGCLVALGLLVISANADMLVCWVRRWCSIVEFGEKRQKRGLVAWPCLG